VKFYPGTSRELTVFSPISPVCSRVDFQPLVQVSIFCTASEYK
jgi:hypothetical protein